MLGPGRYLLGVLEVLLLVGFAWLGGDSMRRWLLPWFEGAPAYLASAVVALALLIWGAELLGAFGWWEPVPYLMLVAVAGLAPWKFLPRPEGEGGGGGPPPPPAG
jgi:protein-S-isoprenylcysteine O-methyltransferase Ste14